MNFLELWVEDNGAEGLLPGFTNFTQKQMFWIRYAHNFCGKPSQKILHKILEDSLLHAPDKYRLLGSIKLIHIPTLIKHNQPQVCCSVLRYVMLKCFMESSH